jgi:hypothetical protein
VNRATKLAGEQILPKLRHVYSDYEDRWWPKALPATRRAKAGATMPAGAAR